MCHYPQTTETTTHHTMYIRGGIHGEYPLCICRWSALLYDIGRNDIMFKLLSISLHRSDHAPFLHIWFILSYWHIISSSWHDKDSHGFIFNT